ncbi:HNH endonuclease [Kiloniella laminariae]|uniref:HNH endonuclease n=1 Tax=Kiloniella laminariae TaxID=454162 RepID=A0ABT4LJR1_9PROT|nr:HNH endonuclease [Kiloniella laminariae]MCZ4281348.1 HNH endonuclease [Kiloniella laminariae]
MAKGVFVHRADSIYDDFPEEQYQFPKRYLKRAQKFEKDWIVYYEPRGGGGRLGYTAIAKIDRIEPDQQKEDMFVAHIAPGTFLSFEKFVPFRTEDGFRESDLKKPDGALNGGLIQWAIRPISDRDFNDIVLEGFPEETAFLPRANEYQQESNLPPGLSDEASEFTFDDERSRVEQTISRIPRDRVFRRHVLDAYDRRCAITGLQLINGGGRAEVEAAHIKPVAANGPDTVRNGIALSGTVHWMFDRGLISLSDDLDILVSRQVNDPTQIHRLINTSGKANVPENPALRPHPKYLGWHREKCFKA